MKVELAYGAGHLDVELPEDLDVTVVRPRFAPRLASPGERLREALRRPKGSAALRELGRPGMRIGIVFSDITRPVPNPFLLGGILEELSSVPRADVTLFNALGTHRQNTKAELESMLGPEVAGSFRIVQNDAFDRATQTLAGKTSFGNEVRLNSELLACDLKILTGFIEPHLFAGFSGGGKAVLPGMAGLESILRNHGAAMVGHPRAIWGVTEGNPVWEEIREAARFVGRAFLVNVALNSRREVTGVFAGEFEAAHAEGCAFVSRTAVVPVPKLFDIVITTNSGHPADINLYQSVKGMRAAERVVKPGGSIIIASRCSEGIPEHGLYGRLLREAGGPRDLLERISRPGFLEQDQWEAQVQALVQLKADVYVYSEGLTDDEIKSCHLKPSRSVETTLEDLLGVYGRRASICVLPEGPQAIPCLSPHGG